MCVCTRIYIHAYIHTGVSQSHVTDDMCVCVCVTLSLSLKIHIRHVCGCVFDYSDPQSSHQCEHDTLCTISMLRVDSRESGKN